VSVGSGSHLAKGASGWLKQELLSNLSLKTRQARASEVRDKTRSGSTLKTPFYVLDPPIMCSSGIDRSAPVAAFIIETEFVDNALAN
jgi:hypothetical protein